MSEARHIHIIGAGMAGLSAALQLTLMGEKVTIYEAAPHAGGRCRSYYDRELDCRIDNGNHLVLSGNVAIQDYLGLTHALGTMTSPSTPLFPFMDLETGERWALRLSQGRLPWWIFQPARRVPSTKPKDYLSVLRIMNAGEEDTVAACLKTNNDFYRRFWEPMVIAALNTEPEKASALLLKNLFAQSFGAGGKSCLPMIPKLGLSESFVEPCLTQLQQHGAEIKFGWRLRGVVTEGLQVKELDFDEDQIELGSSDWVILAVPAWVAEEMVPDLIVPHEFRSIANIHYRIEVPENPTGFTGLIGGLAEWAFVKDGVASVTISAADRHDKQKPQTLAVRVWRDLAKLYDLDPEKTPPWRVVHEKRATFAATPLQNSRRPHPYIGWKNLALAGDWTATSLPSTIEGAIRSGVKASQVVMRWSE